MSNLPKVMQLTNGKSEVTQPVSLRAMWIPGLPGRKVVGNVHPCLLAPSTDLLEEFLVSEREQRLRQHCRAPLSISAERTDSEQPGYVPLLGQHVPCSRQAGGSQKPRASVSASLF